MRCVALLVTCAAVAAGSVTQLRAAGYRPGDVQHRSPGQDPKYLIGEVIANEFDRHVPVLSDNLRGELNTLRNDISRQFDSLKHHMDVKLDRMQRDAPSVPEVPRVEPRPREEPSGAATPAATIRHNLAMAELRRLGADLTRAMNEEVAKLREEFRSSLHNLREQVQNSTDGLASKLGDEFSTQAEKSTTMLKKVFFLTRNQMMLIQSQLSNITSAIIVEKKPTPTTPPPSSSSSRSATSKITPQTLPVTSSATTDSDASATAPAATTTAADPPKTATTTEAITTLGAATSINTTTTTTTTALPTTTEPEDLPRDCMDALNRGKVLSGVTRIRPSQEPKEVWCDQETEGGGWTVMLWRKKQPIQIDFRRNWQSYSEGFGSADGEYWIGLETLYKLTKGNPYNLRVEMTWEDEEAVSLYDFFSVGPGRLGSRGYELNVGGYNKSSTGGDAMEYHSGMDFSTYDRDNDGATGGSCSEWSGGGGWWFNFCYYSNPTGIYPPMDLPPNTQVDHLIEWRKWQGYYTYLSSFRMLIRPN